jgi:TetR/AcrR family transcriptional repressor of nem operon
MPRDGSLTRTKILDVAQELLLDRGFGGMSLDAVIEKAEITKGAFYYHFPTKADLARALVERYAASDEQHYWQVTERAAALASDPLQRILIAVGLMIEDMQELSIETSGCLYASFCYQAGLFEADIHEIVANALRFWRVQLGEQFREAMAAHPPKMEVDPEELADQFSAIFEGGFVLSKSLHEGQPLVTALRHYRNYLELLFGA